MSDSRPGEATAQQGSAESVHPLVRVGAAWTWRLLVLFAGLLALGYVVSKLESVVIPVALALLFAAFLMPAVDNLHRRGVPRSAAVLVAVVGTIGIVGAILSFVVQQFVEGLPDLSDQFTTSVTKAQEWLTQGPLHFSEDQIRHAGDNVVKAIQSNQEALTSGALTTATVIGEIFAGAFLTLFTLVFFLYGGNQVWEFVTRSSRRTPAAEFGWPVARASIRWSTTPARPSRSPQWTRSASVPDSRFSASHSRYRSRRSSSSARSSPSSAPS